MPKNSKENLKALWTMRHLTVNDFLTKIKIHPDLKFLLTTVGIWFLLRWLAGIWIAVHIFYLVYRIFHLVAS